MDVKVIFTDDDCYFKLGISKIIEEALLSCVAIEFLSGIDGENLRQADFILVNVSLWRLLMCQPVYRCRKPGSILLVFANHTDSVASDLLPVCYQFLTLITRNDTVKKVREKITAAWLLANEEKTNTFEPKDCKDCNYSRISLIQLQVMSLLKRGHSVSQAAKILGLSIKTIYAHKYNVMRKFGLKGDTNFISFLNDLSLVELYKGVVNEKKN